MKMFTFFLLEWFSIVLHICLPRPAGTLKIINCREIDFGEKENIINDNDGEFILFALNENDEFHILCAINCKITTIEKTTYI